LPWYSEGGALSLHTIHSWTTGMALADEQRAVGAGSGDPQAQFLAKISTAAQT
jgi:hypothetical protein